MHELPDDVQQDIIRRLDRGRMTLDDVVAEVSEKYGLEVGRSSVHRWYHFEVKGLQRIRESTALAERITKAAVGADSSGGLHAVQNMLTHRALEVLIKDETGDVELTPNQLALLGRMIAAVSSSTLSTDRRIEELKKRKSDADRKVDAMAQDGRLPASAVETIKRLYGLQTPDVEEAQEQHG